ncbi:hypothetical protein ABZW18_10110 [Streptomyces sp. NPDC004647]|uniref:hypothetical protein n=1 Tax=Streptomyces sp. NPDC004647 TaxID=3154671 RepID=UPI0033A8B8DC
MTPALPGLLAPVPDGASRAALRTACCAAVMTGAAAFTAVRRICPAGSFVVNSPVLEGESMTRAAREVLVTV